MNIALPALLVFIVLLPGFVFRSRFKRIERTSFDFSPFGQVVTTAVLLAGALHGIWLTGTWILFNETVAVEAALKLASSDAAAQSAALTIVSGSISKVTKYFSSLLLFSFFVPPLLRKLIVGMKLDRSGARWSGLFRFHGAPWYYLLTGADFEKGKEPDLIVVSAIVDTKAKGDPMLYTGVLEDYFVTPEGDLDRLVLSGVARRPLTSDRQEAGNAAPERFYAIEGDYFVLRYSEAITLNIKYVALQPVHASANQQIPPFGQVATATVGDAAQQ